MKVMTAEEVASAIPYDALVNALDVAFANPPTSPPRHHYDIDAATPGAMTLLVMPAWQAGDYIGTKMVTVAPENSKRSLPTVCGIYILLDAITGVPLAFMDGEELTARRTAATSALAARYLARKDAETLLVVGTGKLAPYFVAAHLAVRNYKKISIWGRSREKAERLQQRLADQGLSVDVAEDLSKAVKDADVISSVTTSREPVIKGTWLKAGCHLDLVGAYREDMRESDNECVKKASIFVDTYTGALNEGGDLMQPLKEGVINREDIRAELSELACGTKEGRQSSSEITLFKSVGASLEDYAAAKLVYETTRS